MADSLYAEFGKVQFPLDASQVVFTIGTVADPAHNALASFAHNVILAEIGEAWNAAIATLQPGSFLDGYIAAVESVIPFDPGRYLTLVVKEKFPLLAVYRGKSEFAAFSLLKQKRTTEWAITYVLPELDAKAMGVLYDSLNAVSDCLAAAIWARSHPAYQDGYNILEQFGFSELDVTSVTTGAFEVLEKESLIVFPAITITAKSVEIGHEFSNPNAVPFTGASIDISLIDSDDPDNTLEDFELLETEHTPPDDS